MEARRCRTLVFVLAILAAYAAITLGNLYLFYDKESVIWRIQSASEGWVNANLLLFLPQTLLIVFLLAMCGGGLSLQDLGLPRRWPMRLIVWTAIGWLLVQLLAALVALVTGQPLDWHPVWAEFGAGMVIGLLIAMIWGTALFEDSFFRGFLIPQFALRLRDRIARPWLRSLAAMMIAAIIFAFWHLPTLLLRGADDPATLGGGLAFMLLGGVMLGILFIRTGDVTLCAALHALVNAPTLLFASAVPGGIYAGLIGIVAMIMGPRLAGDANIRGFLIIDPRRKRAPDRRFRQAAEAR